MDNLSLVSVFARNCSIRRIDKPSAKLFLDANHRMGYATSRYCYGLFVKRSTGGAECRLDEGTIVAVAAFSNARRWQKGDRRVASYEWVRYASLPQVRVLGGMGKLLDNFIKDVEPDDVVTYVDRSWSDGDAYRSLGFVEECTVEKPGFKCLKFRLSLK